MAQTIMTRLAVFQDAETLAEAPITLPDRMHQLTSNRDEQYAVYLVHPYRLVFEPDHDPLPRREDGGIDLERVTAITVIGGDRLSSKEIIMEHNAVFMAAKAVIKVTDYH